MDKPELDMTKMVDAAMNMRTAATTLVQLHALTTINPEHRKAVEDLGSVIDKQQKFIEYLLEKYMSLADATDIFVTQLDEAIKKIEGM